MEDVYIQVKVVDVDQGTFLWTVPSLPLLKIEWKKAKMKCNGVVKKNFLEHWILDSFSAKHQFAKLCLPRVL